jgi:hypothetical protein
MLMSQQSYQPTDNKMFSNIINIPQTPYVKKSSMRNYEDSIRTPIKKSKRRDCTPAYSDEEKENESERNFNQGHEGYYNYNNNNNQGVNLNFNSNFNNQQSQGNLLYNNNFNSNPISQNNNNGFNYNLLKTQTSFNNSMGSGLVNRKFPHQFEKLSKSKFLEKINQETLEKQDVTETTELLEKIKGTYLLTLIECDNGDTNFSKKVFTSLMEDLDFFNKNTNLICYCLFEGFNSRSDVFFKFLVKYIFLINFF